MDYKELLNSAAKWGLALGLIMSVSRVIETSLITSADLAKYTFLTFEWIATSTIYVCILYRANKIQANSVAAEVGYKFSQSLNYSILISIFAAAIVGIVSHIYTVQYIGGYDVYLEKSVAAIASVLEQSGSANEAVEVMLEQSRASIEAMREESPSIFTTIFSSISTYIMTGFGVGLVIAAMTKRKPLSEEGIKDNQYDEQK